MSTTSTIVWTTSTEAEHARRVTEQRRRQHAATLRSIAVAAYRDEERVMERESRTVVGHCTACGSNEVLLDYARPTTGMPSGYGCEVCS